MCLFYHFGCSAAGARSEFCEDSRYIPSSRDDLSRRSEAVRHTNFHRWYSYGVSSFTLAQALGVITEAATNDTGVAILEKLRSLRLGKEVAIAYRGADRIHFGVRYASNLHFGHGPVWNPAPFLPVEGYTSFLWLVVLEAVWSLTGVLPPGAAPPLSIALSSLTLLRVARFAWTRRWMRELPWGPRVGYLAILLGAIVSNTTFLTWATSGLETAFFNLLVCCWLLDGWQSVTRQSRASALVFGVCTALLPLVRPEGMG